MMVNVRTSLEAEAMPDQFPYEPRRHEEHGDPNFLRVLRGSVVCLGGIHLIDIRCTRPAVLWNIDCSLAKPWDTAGLEFLLFFLPSQRRLRRRRSRKHGSNRTTPPSSTAATGIRTTPPRTPAARLF